MFKCESGGIGGADGIDSELRADQRVASKYASGASCSVKNGRLVCCETVSKINDDLDHHSSLLDEH